MPGTVSNPNRKNACDLSYIQPAFNEKQPLKKLEIHHYTLAFYIVRLENKNENGLDNI